MKWAEFRTTKAGIKFHTKYDLGRGIPELVIVSNAKVHDKKKMEELMTEKNCIYVLDKAYVDYKKFDKFISDEKYFITRLEDNATVQEVETLDITYSQIKLLDEGASQQN
ncbi:transposase [Alkaliphilus metalliredigens]|uniref:transposase n=1 Tax=Alkaliphilus metalliredigens TaxID=208226 RepID=UPI00005CB5EA|nr:transposase [Alkaliphilus metalliredigens]